MDRSNWNKDKIEKLEKESRPFEKKLALLLQAILNEVGDIFEVRRGVSASGGKDKYDLDIWYNDRKSEKILMKVECECGNKLKIPWKETLPRNWHCLSLLERKYETLPVKSDFFIKHNPDMTSCFAVNNRWVEKQIENGSITLTSFNHNLDFKTCETRFPVSFEQAKNNPLDVVICEHSDFTELKRFLKVRIHERLSK